MDRLLAALPGKSARAAEGSPTRRCRLTSDLVLLWLFETARRAPQKRVSFGEPWPAQGAKGFDINTLVSAYPNFV